MAGNGEHGFSKVQQLGAERGFSRTLPGLLHDRIDGLILRACFSIHVSFGIMSN